MNRRDAANETEADGSAPRVAAAAPGDALSPFEQVRTFFLKKKEEVDYLYFLLLFFFFF